MQCMNCLRHLRVDAAFCDQCGIRVASLSEVQLHAHENLTDTVVQAASTAAAERRWVTIMFCDLVNSSALSERLEPEDMRAVLGIYQRTCKAAVDLHGGVIARYVGDALLVYFGYPHSREDSPLSAARASMAIISALEHQKLRLPDPSVDLKVRIGIETGSVVIGNIDLAASLERGAAVGIVPNVAARLQALARPNGIVVGGATFRRICNDVDCRALGNVALKGISSPVAAYEVLAEIDGERPLKRRHRLGQMHLLERECERETLRFAWERSNGSNLTVVHVTGEAGVGKSRLVQSLLEDLEGDNFNQLIYRCSVQHQGSPLYPAAMHLQQMLGIGGLATNEEALSRLGEGVERWGMGEQAFGSLAILLGVHVDAAAETPTEWRQKVLSALTAMVFNTARQAPTLLVVEDVHWCDPSTVEFLGSLVTTLASSRLMLLITDRESSLPWATSGQTHPLALRRLSDAASRQLVSALLTESSVPPLLVDQVVERAEGIPLFLEEFADLLIEVDIARTETSDDWRLVNVAIPDSLQDTLTARIERTGSAKRVAQIAATYGRNVSLGHLSTLPECRGVDLRNDLDLLCRKGLLLKTLKTESTEYEFSHSLIRDAAYQSLLREDRQGIHRAIADSFEADHQEIVANQPELLAYHFTEAVCVEKAISYWYAAGIRSMERLANVESIEHLRKGIRMLDMLSAAERPARELQFQTALMPALCATRGYANLEVQQTFSRAHDLCMKLGPSSERSAVLYGLWSYYLVRAELVRSRQLAREMQRIAAQTGDQLRRMEGELAAGLTSMYEGDLPAAENSFTAILELWTLDGPQFFTAGEHIRVSVKAWLGIVYWHQGDIGRARQIAQESLYRARQIGQPISLSFSLYFNIFLAHFCRDIASVELIGTEGLTLCMEKRLFWASLCTLQLGWAQAAKEQGADGSSVQGTLRMIEGLSAFRGAGARLTQTYYLAMIAEAHLRAGDLQHCDRVLREALAAATETGEKLWLCELLRLQAELSLALARSAERTGPPRFQAESEAEFLFKASIDQARSIGSPSLELRTAIGLARLLFDLQRRAEGRAVLSKVLGLIKFVGEPTAEILEARSLIDALAAPTP